MGISGMLLKCKEKFDFDKLRHDVKYAANQANVICLEGIGFKKNSNGTYEYMTFILRDKDKDDNEFLMYAFNDIDDMIDGRYDFIDEKKNYQQCLNIESFVSSKMLLKFIYEYMKLNRDDIFYDELEWYYTFEDIEKIVNMKAYDAEWCYKNPIDLLPS